MNNEIYIITGQVKWRFAIFMSRTSPPATSRRGAPNNTLSCDGLSLQ